MPRSIPPDGGIPPRVRQRSMMRGNSKAQMIENKYKTQKYTHYTRMRTGTLSKLLSYAINLESKLIEVIKLNPNNELLEKLDRIQRLISQLKIQIECRKTK